MPTDQAKQRLKDKIRSMMSPKKDNTDVTKPTVQEDEFIGTMRKISGPEATMQQTRNGKPVGPAKKLKTSRISRDEFNKYD